MIALLLAVPAAFVAGWVMATRGAGRRYERALRTARNDLAIRNEQNGGEMQRLYAYLRARDLVLTKVSAERDLYLDLWKGAPLAKTRWARTGKPLPTVLTDYLRENDA